jgi:hypothetical protein
MVLITTYLVAILGVFLVSSSPIKKRQTSTILSDIDTVSSDIDTLTGDVTSFTGSFFQALPLEIAENNLANDIASTTTAISGSSAFSTADSSSVTSALTALTPNITSLLSDLVAKVTLKHTLALPLPQSVFSPFPLNSRYNHKSSLTPPQASVVASTGYTSIVLGALNKLKSDSDALYAALEAKVTTDAASVSVAQATVDAAFTSAIAAY